MTPARFRPTLPWLLAALLLSPTALAAPKKQVVGVFLPTSLADGQTRFAFSEALATSLTEALGTPVVGRNFGRFEDFSRAVRQGQLNYAVVDVWAAAQLPSKPEPIALGMQEGRTHERWAIVSRGKGAVKDLAKKRLAFSRGVSDRDADFLSHAIFVGDLEAKRHFKLVPVPSVESALQALEAKTAEAALVPSSLVPSGTNVLYRSPRMPMTAVVALSGDAEPLRAVITALSAPRPFEKFVPLKKDELDELRTLIVRGPGRRQPFMAESPLVHPDPGALLNFKEVGLVLPTFLEAYEVSKEQPDD